MKKTLLLFAVIFSVCIIPYSSALSQEWVNCTEGLYGVYTDLYLVNGELSHPDLKPYSWSIDTAKSWFPRKYFDPEKNISTYYDIPAIFKYRNIFIGGSYVSSDKQTWYKFKCNGLPSSSSVYSFFVTDSVLIARVSYHDTVNKMRTYISRDEPKNITDGFLFEPIPVENDISWKAAINSHTDINSYSEINGKIYAVTLTQDWGFRNYYYYSTDEGMSWIADTIDEIFGGIKEIKYLNNQFYIISPVAIWRQEENGTYVQCEDEQFDFFEAYFLVAYKDKIIAQALESGSHKHILASSTDGGKTWEKFGNSDFTIKQLYAMGDKLIANTLTFGVMVSTDDGATWVESNEGIFYSPDRIYKGPYMKIAMKGNEALTAPRNFLLDNVIMKSYDGGITWVKKQINPSIGYPDYTDCHCEYTVAQTKWGVFAINRGDGSTYKTEDYGETWQYYSEGSIFHDADNIYERNDTLFYLYIGSTSFGDKKIYYSTDKGVHNKVYDSTYKKNLPDSSSHLKLIDGIYYAINSHNVLYRSSNEGKSWEKVTKFTVPNNDTTYKIYNVIPKGNKILFFMSSTNQSGKPTAGLPIYMTDNFGNSWKDIMLPINEMYPKKWLLLNGNLYILYTVEMYTMKINDSTIYPGTGYIYKSSDDGVTWEYIGKDLERKEITDIYAGGDYLYASTWEGLFRVYSEPVSVRENTVEEVLLPIELYPSPARDIIQIKNNYYKIKEIKVYDLLGREIAIKKYNNTEFEVTGLEPGVYITRLIFEDNWSITKKFVKM